MLESPDASESQQSQSTASTELPNLTIVDSSGRNPHESSTQNGYRVKSIAQMTELFNSDIPTIFLGGNMGTNDRAELIAFCEKEGLYFYDPDESAPKDPGYETMRETDKSAVLMSMLDVYTVRKEKATSVTFFEIVFDNYLNLGKRVILLVDSESKEEVRFRPKNIVFLPNGSIDFERTQKKDLMHCFEVALNSGDLIRHELLVTLQDLKKICTVEENLPGLVRATKDEFKELKQNPDYVCYEITSNNLHIHEIFKCFIDVLKGKKVAVYFHPPVDKDNFPIMDNFPDETDSIIDQNPSEKTPAKVRNHNPKDEDLTRIVKQFVNGANANRALIINELDNDEDTTFLYNDDLSMQKIKDTILEEYVLTRKRLKSNHKHPQQKNLLQ